MASLYALTYSNDIWNKMGVPSLSWKRAWPKKSLQMHIFITATKSNKGKIPNISKATLDFFEFN